VARVLYGSTGFDLAGVRITMALLAYEKRNSLAIQHVAAALVAPATGFDGG
jgi:hypothetical protein